MVQIHPSSFFESLEPSESYFSDSLSGIQTVSLNHGSKRLIGMALVLMSMEQKTASMKCSHCGNPFRGNPRSQPLGSENYCSIACEEGRAPRAMSDPLSPDYHLHLMAEPESLVGKAVVANGLKLVNYSPDWCKGPEDWSHGVVVSHDPENETYVRKDNFYLGKVVDYDGHYTIEREDLETGEITTRRVKDMFMVDQIKEDRWYVDG